MFQQNEAKYKILNITRLHYCFFFNELNYFWIYLSSMQFLNELKLKNIYIRCAFLKVSYIKLLSRGF